MGLAAVFVAEDARGAGLSIAGFRGAGASGSAIAIRRADDGCGTFGLLLIIQ
ncbi:hypothetical protein [Amycolatopsis rubida]|uniref:hypothetical protein n=1 Tax=Amycolatopsis rubida TaxID=112413 RepID=UPI00142F2CC9|nr:hypothetical protein [Amycolatopsis rubida]